MSEEFPLETRKMKWISVDRLHAAFFAFAYIKRCLEKFSQDEFYKYRQDFINLIKTIEEDYFKNIPEERVSAEDVERHMKEWTPASTVVLFDDGRPFGFIYPIRIFDEDELRQAGLSLHIGKE